MISATSSWDRGMRRGRFLWPAFSMTSAYAFIYQVTVAHRTVPQHKLADKSRQEHHAADDHAGERNVKRRPLCEETRRVMCERRINLVSAQVKCESESNKKNQRSNKPEKMHGPFAEFRKEKNGEKIQESVNKAAPPKLACTVFSGLMLHHFLP